MDHRARRPPQPRVARLLAVLGTVSLFVKVLLVQSVSGATEPELPRLHVDTTYAAPPGRTIAVPAGGDFQGALNAAEPGDVIALKAGTTFTGPFVLPKKPGSEWITVRTSTPDSHLPPPGTRVDPTYATVMPKLVAASGSVLTTAPGAHHYRFVGIEIRPRPDVFLYDLVGLGPTTPPVRSVFNHMRFGPIGMWAKRLYNVVRFGITEALVDDLPHDIIFDRCYLHGDLKKGARRGIALNSRMTVITDSYLSDFKEVGADSQAIAGWAGPGPFKIVNNYLEAAGENLLFGGADPSIKDLVPSDIEIRRNHFFKPLTWRIEDPRYAGTPWTVKNLLELKNARRVLIDGNLFEHSWRHAQGGTAIVFTVRNQDGAARWSTVEDVAFTDNIVRHAGSGVWMHGRDDLFPSQPTKRILIKNNLFDDVSRARWGGTGRLFQSSSGIEDLVIDHNTGFQDGSVLYADGAPHVRFVYRNNIALHNDDGVHGTETRPGRRTLDTYAPGYIFARNILTGGNPALYPADNFFPASLHDVGFVDLTGGDYRLSHSSPYKRAGSDGKDVGADLGSLSAARSLQWLLHGAR